MKLYFIVDLNILMDSLMETASFAETFFRPSPRNGYLAETIDELIDTNPKCRLFFKIDLQEFFAALICLSADEFCQPFSWGGNFYVDSGSWATSSHGIWSTVHLNTPLPPQSHTVCIFCSLGRGGGRRRSERRNSRGATVHKYSSFVHGGNSSQAGSKIPANE